MSEGDWSRPYEAITPLVSSRTLQSAHGAHTVSGARLPLRAASVVEGTGDEPRSRLPLTVGRSTTMLRRPATIDKQGNRKTSEGRSNEPTTTDTTDFHKGSVTASASRIGTLKRTSTVAGLESDAEISTIKRQLARALREIEDQKQARERDAVENASKIATLQAQVQDESVKNERLERHRAILLAKERSLEDQVLAKRQDDDRQRLQLSEQVRTLRREMSQLQQTHADTRSTYKDLEHQHSQCAHAARTQTHRVSELEATVETLETALATHKLKLSQEQERSSQAEATLEAERQNRSDSANVDIVKQELHRQVAHLRLLEKENAKLERRLETYERQHANIEILKEANKSLERKVQGMDQLRETLATQVAELQQLQRERTEWQSFLAEQGDPALSSPRKVTKLLAATQIENATLREKVDTANLELTKRDTIIGRLEESIGDLERTVTATEKRLHEANSRTRQDEARRKLLEREVEMLKEHLGSYTAEEAAHHSGYDAQKTTRLRELEDLLEAHKSQLADMSKQVSHYRGLAERYGGSTTEFLDGQEHTETLSTPDTSKQSILELLRVNEDLRSEIDELRNANALLEKEIDALDQQVASLEQEHGARGAFDPEKTRILEFKDSPDRMEHAIRSATLERLRNENSELLARITQLSGAEGDAAASALVPLASLESAKADLVAAKAAVVQKETMLKRISQAVAEKTEGMRIAISQLLGYQLSFLESGRIRVTSVYAPSKDRSLAFDPWPGGPMPYKLVSAADHKMMRSADVRQSINFWLESRSSLPGFMASLTMTLFEETTRGAAGGVVVA